MGSTASKATSAPVPVRSSITTTESNCCAIVVGSTAEVLKKNPARGTKRRADEVESLGEAASDADDEATAPNAMYGGLGDYENDSLKQAAAVASPVKP